jgi:pimeloyl-ACP methyl ester carboxylesterase
MTAYHPFRSTTAKEQYLKLYDMRAKKWPVDSQTRLEDTSYGQTFVRMSGPVGAPPLVLLHGAGGNSLQWLPNIEALSKSFMYWLLEDLAQKDEASRIMLEEEVDAAFLRLRCFKPSRLVNPTVLEDEELKSIKVPTLYLVGEHEKIYSAQKAIQRLHKVAPHIKAEVIPNAGHDLTIVQAEMVNTKVLEFLKQL